MMEDDMNNNKNNSNMGDLRNLFSPRPQFQTNLFALKPVYEYESGVGVQNAEFQSEWTTTTTSTSTSTSVMGVGKTGSGLGFDVDVEAATGISSTRWPRQETLTLLEVRSRLHHLFNQAHHKAPLWDQVSRIMLEENGYQRSGKKCREKFENLYKYYKKTKDGKAEGGQDGKHYRFFRQLEALFGESEPNPSHLSISSPNNINNNNISIHHQFHSAETNSHRGGGSHSISLFDDSSSKLHTSSSADNDLNRVGLMEEGGGNKKRRGKRSWKSKINDFVDLQMRKIIEKQEASLDKMTKTLEHKEKERMAREEKRRSRESERMEQEHKKWADERAWIEARDRALIDSLRNLTSKEIEDRWAELEITELIRLKAIMDARFELCGGSEIEGSLWEEIARRIASLGYDNKSAKMCKEKYLDLVNAGHVKSKERHKKRKENSRIESDDCSEINRLCGYEGEIEGARTMGMIPPEISLRGGGLNPMTDSFKFLLGNDGDTHLLASYGVKLNKGN